MFWKKKPFKVKLKGRSGIEYIEGERRVLIASEFMSGEDPGIVIYSNDLTSWDPPHDHESLSESDIERIKSNVLEDLKSHRIIAEWD
jgi:hypothetical protein